MIPFSPPKIYQELIDEVIDTLKSGWITTGPKTKLFEKNLATYIGVKHVLCLNSATAGLEIMLRWLGIGKGDEVIVPVYTYCATANVVLHCGATPVFVDVGEDFNIAIDKIKPLITDKTKAIIPVDFGGFPCDYDELYELINNPEIKALYQPNNEVQQKLNRIFILSDAAHSLGATYKNKKTGTIADATVFSFHAVKNLTTSEGGAIAFNLPAPFDNKTIYDDLCIKTLHGQSKDALAKTKIGGWKYDVIEPGFKMNMTDIQAAMGLVELKHYEKETLPKRKQIIDFYNQNFSQYSWAELPPVYGQNKTSSFHLYALRIKGINEQQRNLIIEKITQRNVGVNVHFQPLPLLSVYQSLGYKIEDFPVAYNNYSREISLPVYYDLSMKDAKIVVSTVVEAVESVLNA